MSGRWNSTFMVISERDARDGKLCAGEKRVTYRHLLGVWGV